MATGLSLSGFAYCCRHLLPEDKHGAWQGAGTLDRAPGHGAEGWLPGRLRLAPFGAARVFLWVLSAAFINTVFLFSLSLINFSNFSSPPVQQ